MQYLLKPEVEDAAGWPEEKPVLAACVAGVAAPNNHAVPCFPFLFAT